MLIMLHCGTGSLLQQQGQQCNQRCNAVCRRQPPHGDSGD
jgi:hypothetical protein